MNSDCIFCKIISGEAPASKVYEDNETLAFLSIHPVNKGHVLVIPKDHVETTYGWSDEIACRLILTAKKISIAVKNALDADEVNLLINNGENPPHVLHSHIHIIPRYNDDGLLDWPEKSYEEGEIGGFAEKVRKEVM